MTRINLTKYGFVRWPEEDFSDDGNRFTCYKVGKRVRVSKLISHGDAFISAGIDDYKLPYEVYGKLPHYRDLADLNGVSVSSITEEDLQKLYEACISYEVEYDKALSEMNWPTKEEIKAKAIEFFNAYVVVYNKLEEALKYNMLAIAEKCSQYEWSQLRDYIKHFRSEYELYSNPDEIADRMFMQTRSIDFVKKTSNIENNYWVKCINEIIDKYCY